MNLHSCYDGYSTREAIYQSMKKKKVVRRTQRTPNTVVGLWRSYQAYFFLAAGVVLLSLSVTHFYLQRRALLLSRSQVADFKAQSITRKPEPTRIYIQWFIDTPIESMSLSDGIWGISRDKASYLIQSARPGENGNIIIYGHNTRQILGNIRALKGGEKVTVTTSDGSQHTYTVTHFEEVPPSQVQLLQPTQTEVLTLYTCSGLLDSQRFIVRATPL